MKIRRDEEGSAPGPNMTPLIDMLFILIIFFLATSRFQAEERDEEIQLVETRSELPISTPRDLLVIDIDREGRKKVNGVEKTLEELEEIIRERIEEHRESEVVLRSDRRALVAHLMETTEICHRLGLEAPKITYRQE